MFRRRFGFLNVEIARLMAGSSTPEIVPPSRDWYVAVTGISSSECPSPGTVIRVLRPRRQEDIVVKSPADSAGPTVQITNPAGSEILKLPSTTEVQLAGTAEDSETGVTWVQVRVGTGEWQTAAYNSTSHVWTYTWNNPSSATISVRAMDFAGQTTEISRSVTVAAPQVIYVSKDGNNNNDGWTWSTAKFTIQNALTTASAQSVPQVWVAKGTYYERITLPLGVCLYGGFFGTESLLTERPAFPRQASPDPNAVVLNGSGAGNVVAIGNVNALTTIDGFTIENGGVYSGIRCTGSSAPSIANNTIKGNATGIYLPYPTATGWIHHNTITDNGDGICLEGAGTVVVEDNHIDHNGATAGRYGVGIRINGGASPTIERNWIEYNNLLGDGLNGYDGGGIWCANGSRPNIYNNVIKGNRALKGGAIFVTGVCTVSIANNTISNNYAYGGGGALYSCQSDVTIANNILYNNQGVYGVYANDTTPRVHAYSNCAYLHDYGHYSSMVTVHSSLASDPGLSSDGVHLTNTSVCVDAGTNTYYHGPSDIFGGPRLAGTRVDIGADEFGSP